MPSQEPITTLVLLPGMDGTGELFSAFIEALGSKQKIIVVRYPVLEAMNYAELELVARTTLPHDSPYILLGESFSGPIAISIAASAPDQLKGLILCCSFAKNPRAVFFGLRLFVRKLPNSPLITAAMSRFVLGKFSAPPLRAQIIAAVSQVAAGALRSRLQAVLAIDVSARLCQIKVPTLYLKAKHDRLVPSTASELVKRLLPTTQVIELESSHFLLQSTPTQAAKIINEFASKISTPT